MSLQHTSLSPTYDPTHPHYEKNLQYQSKMIDTANTVYKKSKGFFSSSLCKLIILIITGEVSSPQRSPNLVRDYDYPQDTGMMKGT